MSVRNLEDEIFRLQKLDLQPEVASVVQEAAQALAAAKELEAEALIEKAEALLRNSRRAEA